MMKPFGILRSILLASAFVGSTGIAMADTYIVAVGAAQNSLQGQSASKFAKELQERLGSEHTVEFYSDGQLGDEKELMQKLRLGTVQFTLLSSIMTTVSDKFALFDLPFLVQNRAHMKAINAEVVMPDLAPTASAKGLKVISTWENGYRQITNNIRPIVTPDDLSGLKIRTPSSEWRVAMFKQYGANPTAMAFSELFVALQTGTMDGQENPLTNIVGANLNEVQKYLSLSGHVYSPTYLTSGTATWDALPEDVKTAINDVAGDVQSWAFDAGEKADVELVDKVKAGGMEVNEVDHAAFVAASEPIYTLFAEKVDGGADLVKKVSGLAAK